MGAPSLPPFGAGPSVLPRGGRRAGLQRTGARLTMAGGAVVLLTGLLFLGIGIYLAIGDPGLRDPGVLGFLVVEPALGGLLLALGQWAPSYPDRHVALGGLVVLCAIASLFFPIGGGFLIGAILAVFGGILLIVGRPAAPIDWSSYTLSYPPPPSGPAPPPSSVRDPPVAERPCPTCGGSVPVGATSCYHCGAPIPMSRGPDAFDPLPRDP